MGSWFNKHRVEYPEPSSGQSSTSGGGLRDSKCCFLQFSCVLERTEKNTSISRSQTFSGTGEWKQRNLGMTRGSPRHLPGCSQSLIPCTFPLFHPSFQSVPSHPGFDVTPALSTSSAPLFPILVVLLFSSRHCCPEELAVPFQLLL